MALLPLYEAPNGGQVTGFKGSAKDALYISQCKRCGWGIFKPTRPVWSTDPIGWVHPSGQCRERLDHVA